MGQGPVERKGLGRSGDVCFLREVVTSSTTRGRRYIVRADPHEQIQQEFPLARNVVRTGIWQVGKEQARGEQGPCPASGDGNVRHAHRQV